MTSLSQHSRQDDRVLHVAFAAGSDVDAVIATVAGEIDMASAPAFVRRFEGLFAARPSAVVVDLAQVSFLGSAGLVALLALSGDARAAGVAFCVVSNRREVLRPLHMTALDQAIVVCTTFADARTWLQSSPAA